MNPFKAVGRAFKAGGKGAWKGMKIGYRQATRPEILAALQIGGMFIPGVNALGMLTFLRMVKSAEMSFPKKGSGANKARHVMASVLQVAPQLKAWGVPTSEWKDYLESAVLLMQGRASLVSDVDGAELLEDDLDRLAALFDAAEGSE